MTVFILYLKGVMPMKQNDVLKSIKRLNEVIRHQQGIMSPDSNGKGHGKLLQTIADNEGLSGVELALRLNIAPPVISEKLSGLEDDGMIRRERDRKDRRKNHIYITPDGVMALARREFGQKRFEERIGECLSDEEQIQFCDMCERIMSGVRDMSADDEKADDGTVINFYEEQKARRKKREEKKDRESGKRQ